MSAVTSAAPRPASSATRRHPAWLPLAGLVLLAAVLRFATLGEQSFWYDEAFTPVHVLHGGLWATLRGVVHTENTPPLWYILAWLDVRLFGDGEVALRLPSAIAGVLTVPVVWAIAGELASRRAALIGGAIVAVNPLFVWYSQEARAYGLFVLMAALAMLCFVRAEREPTSRRLAMFALAAALALLTHYFAVFLLVPMALWLLRKRELWRAALPAVIAIALVGLALLPLISAQGGHGTQWIGRWALSSRLEAIPQYYLTGYSSAPLGHGVELLVLLVVLAGAGLGAWRLLDDAGDSLASMRRGAGIALWIACWGVLGPIVLVAFGADYLAPRNLVGAMVAVSVLLAILLATIDREHASIGAALAATICFAFLLLTVDVDLSPRLQRGDWRGLASKLGPETRPRAITTVQLGAAPLEYYVHHLHNLPRNTTVTVSEIDETGYAPLRLSAGRPPAPGFHLLNRLNVNGLILYRFVSAAPRPVSEAELRRRVITLAHPEVLVSGGVAAAGTLAARGPQRREMSLAGENI